MKSMKNRLVEILKAALTFINEMFPRKSTDLIIEDEWYNFTIKKSFDDSYTIVGDPDFMEESEELLDAGIKIKLVTSKTVFT